MNKYIMIQMLAIGLAGLLLCGCGKEKRAEFVSEGENGRQESKTETAVVQEQEMIFVYVCGAVANPQVVQLKQEARVYEALEAVGGMREDAAVELVNLAEKLQDGQKLYILTEEEAEQSAVSLPESGQETQAGSDVVNINRATAQELMTLPGIGQAKAESIIAYREEHGSFSSTEELKNVEGIKDGVWNKIKDCITVK